MSSLKDDNLVKFIFLLIFDLFLSIFSIPIVIILLSPLFLYKNFVILLAKILRPNLRSLCVNDSYLAWDLIYPLNGRHVYNIGVSVRINGILSVDGVKKKIIDEIFEKCGTKKKTYPRLFEDIISFGGYAFRKPLHKFNINSHVRLVEVKFNNLDDFTMKWIESGYGENMAPWELVIIHFHDIGESILLMKTHHAIADAYSQLHLFNFLVGNKVPNMLKEPEDSIFDRIRQLVRVTRVSIIYSLEVMLSYGSLPFKFKCTKGDTFRSAVELYLDDLKYVQRKTGASLTSITLSIFGGVLSKILEEKGENMGPDLNKATYVSVSLPKANHPLNKMVNHWASAGIRVPLSKMSSIARLKSVDENLGKFMRRELDKMMSVFLMPPGTLIPLKLCEKTFEFWRKLSGLQTIFTSVLAFNDKFYEIDGHPIISVQPASGFLGTTPVLSGVAFCYKDSIQCTFNASSEVAESQETLNKYVKTYLCQELQNLMSDVGGTTSLY